MKKAEISRVLFGVTVVLSGILLYGATPSERPAHPEPARMKGWAWQMPPDKITPVSGRRNHIFFVGDSLQFELEGSGKPETYEVLDYYGVMVDSGSASEKITLDVKRPGWYKLYIYGKETRPEWGDILGTTTFVIFRKNSNFPDPEAKVEGNPNYYPSMDQVSRAVTGMGPQRHHVADASKAEEEIKRLEESIAYDMKEYAPRDPLRKRGLMIAFPNGTKDTNGVRRIVEHYKDSIKYWEPRNEPNFGASASDFVEKELKPFYETVKSVDPSLKVMGPGTVSIGPQLIGWLWDFFQAGGGKYIDVFSFHIYNGINGDIVLGRKTMDQLGNMLEKSGYGNIEKWQTEQGYFACLYGSYQPRLQGRWTMLEMMIFEQYGIPKENNHLWYDRSHGFWDFPTWWVNDDGGYNPAAPLMRVMSEELYGTKFSDVLDFGPEGNNMLIGSLFEGQDRDVVAIMNAGCGTMQIPFKANAGTSVRAVSPFGFEINIALRNGMGVLEVGELPVYVRLAKGQKFEPGKINLGVNLARLPDVKVTSSGTGKHPADANIPNDISKLTNGEYENWYWKQTPDAQPWMDDTPEFPAWVQIEFPAPTNISSVVVYACPPWQWQGTLVDHEVQAEYNGKWVTIGRIAEPIRTFSVYSPPTRTSVDSFFSDRWIFWHSFKQPVTTSKLRILVHDTTYGGGATKQVVEAGGQTGPHQLMLREIEVY